MTSPVKLPPLPSAVDTVRALFRGQPDYFQAQDSYYTQDQMRAYAEKAVREAMLEIDSIARKRSVGRVQDGPSGTVTGFLWRNVPPGTLLYVVLPHPDTALPDVQPELTCATGAQFVSMETVQTVLRAARAALSAQPKDPPC